MTRLRFLMLLPVASILVPVTADAQRLLERVRRAATQIAAEEVMQHADALLGDAALRVVDDGRFMAVATPWLADDGSTVVNRTNITGHAVVVRSGGGFALLLCDDSSVGGWVAQVGVANVGEARQPPPGEDGDPVSPFAGQYELGTGLVAARMTGAGVLAGEAGGTLRIESVADDVWSGTVTFTLPAARLGPGAEPRSVNVATAFRARPASANTPPNCTPAARR